MEVPDIIKALDSLPKKFTTVGLCVLDDGMHRAYAVTAKGKIYHTDTDKITGRLLAKKLNKIPLEEVKRNGKRNARSVS